MFLCSPNLISMMEEAGHRGIVEHVGHVFMQLLLAPRVTSVKLYRVVAKFLNKRATLC